jgi:hypothetical protein
MGGRCLEGQTGVGAYSSPDIAPGFRDQVRLQWFWVRAWTDRDTERLSLEGRRVPRAAAGVHEPKQHTVTLEKSPMSCVCNSLDSISGVLVRNAGSP